MSKEAAGADKHTKMTTLPVEGLVCRMAVPTIVIMLVSAVYSVTDTYFVSQISTGATAGVGVSFPLMAFIQALGLFFGQGCGNYISRMLGARDLGAVSRMTAAGFVSALLAGVLIMTAGLLDTQRLALILGSTETILPYASAYLRFILMGAPWMIGSILLNNILRFQGSPLYAMIGIVSGTVLNIGLTPLFIFVFDMGVAGAGASTMVSQAVSFVILLVGCRRGGAEIKLKNFTPCLSIYKEIAMSGLPSLCRQLLAGMSAVVLNRTAGAYGDEAIAALSIVSRMVMLIVFITIGFAQGFQPVAGFNYGAGRYDRVMRSFWFGVKVSTAFLAAMAAIAIIFAPQIIALFLRDSQVIEIGATTLRLMSMSFPLLGFIIMANVMLQTIGKAGRASILASSRQGVFLIAYLLTLPRFFGLLGIQLSVPFADVSAFILSVPITASVLKEMKNAWEGAQKSSG